jgi:hypothetical protein
MLLVNGANYLVERSRAKGAFSLIVLIGAATWLSLIWQLMQPTKRLPIGFYSSPGWQVFRIAFAIVLMAGLTTWRRWLPGEKL